MEPKRTVIVKGGELKDHPGWYKLDGRLEDDLNKAFGMVRKPDGTWWRVAGEHYFPPEGGDVRIELGEQITKQETLDQIEEYYEELLRQAGSETDEGRCHERRRPSTCEAERDDGNDIEFWQHPRCSEDRQRCSRWRWRLQPQTG
jgi:hypothetical protein